MIDFTAVMFWVYWFPLMVVIVLLLVGASMGLVRWKRGR
jgi:hypothetical protein